MNQNCIGNDVQSHAADGVESGKCQPQQTNKSNVLLHAARTRLHERDRSDDLLTAFAAESLALLNYGAASIAEHEFLPANHSLRISTQIPTTDDTEKISNEFHRNRPTSNHA
jgi:hypothetical protein